MAKEGYEIFVGHIGGPSSSNGASIGLGKSSSLRGVILEVVEPEEGEVAQVRRQRPRQAKPVKVKGDNPLVFETAGDSVPGTEMVRIIPGGQSSIIISKDELVVVLVEMMKIIIDSRLMV